MVRRPLLILVLLFYVNTLSADERESLTLDPCGDIQLGHLENDDTDVYLIKSVCNPTTVSIRLYGHISQTNEPVPPYLQKPKIRIEKNRSTANTKEWETVAEAHSPGSGIETAYIQNVVFEADIEYRIVVAADSSQGGRYALIVDPVIEGTTVEIEDLDFGLDPYGRPQSLSTGYVVFDPKLPSRARVYIGTEWGYLLVSEDDCRTWKQIYPEKGIKPHGSIYGLFVDSQGIIYLSEWTSQWDVSDKKCHGALMESRDGGQTWREAIHFQWPTGVGWRMCEDSLGNVFVGEYAATWPYKDSLLYNGNIWRRKNYGNSGEAFEIVFANPLLHEDPIDPNNIPNLTWGNNHVHFIDVDPYTGDLYATIGDGVFGRFIRSKQHGDPGTWETLERGCDAQYTSVVFTPDYLFLGQDTTRQHKKVVRWQRNALRVNGCEPYWTTITMIEPNSPPQPYFDRGNWFWGHYAPNNNILWMQYLPYGVDRMKGGQVQAPRLFASPDQGETWSQVITFPPLPEKTPYGFYGPKLASNMGPNGWIYAMRGTFGEKIHRGFRFRIKPKPSSNTNRIWELYR